MDSTHQQNVNKITHKRFCGLTTADKWMSHTNYILNFTHSKLQTGTISIWTFCTGFCEYSACLQTVLKYHNKFSHAFLTKYSTCEPHNT